MAVQQGGGASVATSLQPMGIGNAGLGDTTNASGQAAQYTVHTARGASTGLVLTFAAVTYSGIAGELPLGNDLTVHAAIEYPLASGTFTNVTFSSSTTGTVTNGSYLDSDPFTRTWADGDQFGLWVWASGALIPTRGTGGANNVELYTDEACQVGASVSTTPTNAPTDSLTRRRRLCACVGIFGQKVTTATTVAILGDSHQAYTSANMVANSATSDHVRGDMTRTISQDYACINLGLGGHQVSADNLAPNTIYTMLAKRATVIVDAFGINEFNNKALTGAQALAYRDRWLPRWNGKRYISATLMPQTTSTDSFITEANQTVKSYDTDLDTYNTPIRALPQFIERRVPVKGVAANKWKVDGATTFLETVDGLHPSLAGVSDIMATRTTIKSAIDAATSALAATQPSVTLSGGTFSGGYLNTGTATLGGIVPLCFPTTFEFRFVATAITSFSVQAGPNAKITLNSTFLRLTDGRGTTTNGTTNVLDGVEHHVRVVCTASSITVSLGGVVEITVSFVPTSAQSKNQLSLTASAGNNKMRQLAIWNTALATTFTPPAAGSIVGNEVGLVSYWPLATDGTGLMGPGLPS
jgi:hypothetical protein